MSLLQKTIEKSLSRLLGADIAIERMKLSPLNGRLEIEGLSISFPGFEAPLLVVPLLRAEVSVAMALTGQIVVKSVAIERPVVSIFRRPDGAMNLPRLNFSPSASHPSRQWRLPSIAIAGAEIRFHDQTAGSAYHIFAENIDLDASQTATEVAFKIALGSVGRQDIPVSLGSIQLAGRFTCVTAPDQILQSPLEIEARFERGTIIKLNSPGLASRATSVELQGPLDLPAVLAMFPFAPSLLPLLTRWQYTGGINVTFGPSGGAS